MEEAQSTVSVSNGMPHHATGTIAEEEQEGVGEQADQQGADPAWAGAAAAAIAAAGTDWAQISAARQQPGAVAGEGSEPGQNWNWPWLTGQLASEHGALDPNALLDDESESESHFHQE